MSEPVEIIFGLIGGLAMFLYGMNRMSEALQKAAGAKMKRVLEVLTKNAVMGAVAGALVTAVLQSSSATTVMVIGFVSAGLMSLPQAISVIFGANIGTTMTAQLMAFKISNYIYPIIFIGFILNFVGKKEKIKNIGMVIFSFGLLFEGIEIMGGVMKPLASSSIFVDLMGQVSDIPILGVLLGAVMTLVVQSSSATIAVLQNFASQAGPDGVSSVIGLTGAIPILLGDNIGTTITALLASIGQSKNAKRTAIAHSIFNISGSLVFLFLIKPFAALVQMITPGEELVVISRQIANAHTLFNLTCTIVWLPLIPVMVKIVNFLIRGEDQNEMTANTPRFLDRHVTQPLPAMHLVSQEILRLADDCKVMIIGMKDLIRSTEESAVESFKVQVSNIRDLQNAIADYVSKMFASGNLTEEQAERTAGLLFVSNNIDRIADRCEEIADSHQYIRTEGKKLSAEALTEIDQCVDITETLFTESIEAVNEVGNEKAEHVIRDSEKMHDAQRENMLAHLDRVKNQRCDASLTQVYTDMMYSLERASDNCVGIAEESMDTALFVSLEETGFKSLEEVRANE